MKRINAKKIATVAAGAALLGIGLAFAAPVTFQNVQIIGSSGQPLVQVVVGSKAAITDGIAAANIAAAIGNLAYTSVGVTASVNTTNAASVLHVTVTNSSNLALSNQQVYLNETGAAYASGSYSFGALIGSVLNRAVKLSAPLNTKTLQGTGQYSYPESTSLTSSPAASPYTASAFVPFTSVSGNSNGGGVSFTSGFTSGGTYDNILRVSSSNLPSLLSNAGANGENEYLWLTGFPVYDQASGVQNFQILSVGGAYQVTFNKPIPLYSSSGTNVINNAAFELLGENWTIINGTKASGSASSTTTVNGGHLELASSLSPLTTVYVGQNIKSGAFKVELTDIGRPNSNGVSPAGIAGVYNGALTNVTSLTPGGGVTQFNVSGHNLYVKVTQTFAGLYAYQKYAKIQMYSNVYNITDGKVFNQTNDPGWTTQILWTNGTSGSTPNMLQSIILYNSTPTSLSAGQSFSFIQNPAVWKFTFVGDNLGSNYDPISFSLSSPGSVTYQNAPGGSAPAGLSISNITEPAQELTMTSSIPNAFSYAGQVGSSVTYDLTAYRLVEDANQPTTATVNIILSGPAGLSFINNANPLTVTVKGYRSQGGTAIVSAAPTFNGVGTTNTTTVDFFNVTSITLSRAVPGLTVEVVEGTVANTPEMAELDTIAPQILYSQSGKTYDLNASGSSVIYNQQNGQATSTFSLAATNLVASKVGTLSGTPATGSNKYFTYTVKEYDVPSSTSSSDSLAFSAYNSTTGVGATPLFQLNQSATGTRNNMTYTSSSSSAINAQVGFRTERGSKVAQISPGTATIDYAKAVDQLQFVVGPSSTTVTSTAHTYGPFGIGQTVNMPGVSPNVTVARITASITGSASGYTITGLNNLTATPSVSMATVPVLLKNLTTTPLVVLDSQANPASSLVLIGSGYVNTLSQQLQTSENITFTPTTQIVQAYGNKILVAGYTAAQTTAAANQFIADLYAAASS